MADKQLPHASRYSHVRTRSALARKKGEGGHILDTSDLHLRYGEGDVRELVSGTVGNFETITEHGAHVFRAIKEERQRTIEKAVKLLHDPAIDETHTLQEALNILRTSIPRHELIAAEPSIKNVSKLQQLIYAIRGDFTPPPSDSKLWEGIDPEMGSVQIADSDEILAYAPEVGDGSAKTPPKHAAASHDTPLTLSDGTEVHAVDAEGKAFLDLFKSGLKQEEVSPELIRFDAMLSKLRDIDKEHLDIACEHMDMMCQNARDFATHLAMQYNEDMSQTYWDAFGDEPEEAADQYLEQFMVDAWHLLRTVRHSHHTQDLATAHRNEDAAYVRSIMREVMAHAIRDASDDLETMGQVKPFFDDAISRF